MQQVKVDAAWHKGFFGESCISWGVTVSARNWVAHFPTRASHNLFTAALPTSVQNLQIKEDFTACLLYVQQNRIPSPPPHLLLSAGHDHTRSNF